LTWSYCIAGIPNTATRFQFYPTNE
jgi:hypothetical protein